MRTRREEAANYVLMSNRTATCNGNLTYEWLEEASDYALMSNRTVTYKDHMTFEWLLEYQIQLAMRYRYFVSIVTVTNGDGNISIHRLLEQTVRNCDQFFDLKEESAIVMPHTSQDEAYIAVCRYKERCNDAVDLHFSIVSYPADATTSTRMLEMVKRLKSKIR